MWTALPEVNLPEAASIGDYTFGACTSLATVILPKATVIDVGAFSFTGGTALTITLGDTPPTVGSFMFYAVNASKAVAVKVPSGAVSSYDATWQDAFKGTGNTGDTGMVDNNITLTIQGY
jgi:hypothetical protein